MALTGGYPGLAIYVALIWTTLWLQFPEPAVLIVKLNSCGSCSRQYTQSTKDLHPHMMYGALMSSLDVLRQSIRDVCPAVVHLGKWITRFKKEAQPGWTSVMWISSMFGPFQTEVWIIVMRSVRLVLVLLLLPASQQHDHNNHIFIFVVRESSFSGHESLLWLRPGFLHHVPAGGCGTISGDQWNVDCRSTKNRDWQIGWSWITPFNEAPLILAHMEIDYVCVCGPSAQM